MVNVSEKQTKLMGLEFYSFVPDIIPRSILRMLVLLDSLIEKRFLARLAMHEVIILKKNEEK